MKIKFVLALLLLAGTVSAQTIPTLSPFKMNATSIQPINKSLETVLFKGLTVGNSTSTLAGTIRYNGTILQLYNGSTWTSIGSGGSGVGSGWATNSANTILYPADLAHIVVIGADSTSSAGTIFETNGNAYIKGALEANRITTTAITTTHAWIGTGTGLLEAIAGKVGVTSSVFALQSALNDYATKLFVTTGYVASTTLDTYATKSFVSTGYVASTTLDSYATKLFVTDGYVASTTLGSYATKLFVTDGYVASTTIGSYATKLFVTDGYVASTTLDSYATKSFVTTGYVPTTTGMTFAYGSSTFPSFSYGSSTYVTYGYGTSTYADKLNYPSYTYGTSTYADKLNYPSYTYASGTFPTFSYTSTTFATKLFVTDGYAPTTTALVKGTLTSGKYCTYTGTGNTIDCTSEGGSGSNFTTTSFISNISFATTSLTFATGSATGLDLTIVGNSALGRLTFTPVIQSGYQLLTTASSSAYDTAQFKVNSSSTNWDNAYFRTTAGTYTDEKFCTWESTGSFIDCTAEGSAGGITNLAGQTGGTQTFSTGTPPTGLDFKVVSSADNHAFNLSMTSGYFLPTSSPSFVSVTTTNLWTTNASTTNLTATGLSRLATTTQASSTINWLNVQSGLFANYISSSAITNSGNAYLGTVQSGTWQGNAFLYSGGTLTSGNHCRADGTSGAIDCDRAEDGSGTCAANSVCMGGHTHPVSEQGTGTTTIKTSGVLFGYSPTVIGQEDIFSYNTSTDNLSVNFVSSTGITISDLWATNLYGVSKANITQASTTGITATDVWATNIRGNTNVSSTNISATDIWGTNLYGFTKGNITNVSSTGITAANGWFTNSTTTNIYFTNASGTSATIPNIWTDNLLGYWGSDCGANQYAYGLNADGTLDCRADATGGDAGFFATSGTSGLLTYLADKTSAFAIGGTATNTATFWIEPNSSTTYIGQDGAGDGGIIFGDSMILGRDYTDNNNLVLSAGTALGTNNVLTITSTSITANQKLNWTNATGTSASLTNLWLNNLFGNVSSTVMSFLTKLYIPNGDSVTSTAAGDISINTTYGQLRYFDGTNQKVLTPVGQYCFSDYSPTTTAGQNGAPIATPFETSTAFAAFCTSSGATVQMKFINDQTDMVTMTCPTTGNSATGTISALTINQYKNLRYQILNVSAGANYVHGCIYYRKEPQ